MTDSSQPEGAFGRFLRLLALLAGAVVVLLMVFTVLDVFLRYVFNRPFSSSIEITEFSMAIIVFLGIAYCGLKGGHVAVDILERPLENPRLRFIPVILTSCSALLFASMAYFVALEAFTTLGRVSNMLRWPHFPFQIVVAFGSAMYAIVLAIQVVQMLQGKPTASIGDKSDVAK